MWSVILVTKCQRSACHRSSFSGFGWAAFHFRCTVKMQRKLSLNVTKKKRWKTRSTFIFLRLPAEDAVFLYLLSKGDCSDLCNICCCCSTRLPDKKTPKCYILFFNEKKKKQRLKKIQSTRSIRLRCDPATHRLCAWIRDCIFYVLWQFSLGRQMWSRANIQTEVKHCIRDLK